MLLNLFKKLLRTFMSSVSWEAESMPTVGIWLDEKRLESVLRAPLKADGPIVYVSKCKLFMCCCWSRSLMKRK
jgi:hypothetical protein